MSLASTYIDSALHRMISTKELGDKTFSQLGDRDFFYMPNESSNSIALIIQHMAGNMLSRWVNFLTEDGEKAWRRRDDEFEPQDLSRAQLVASWEKGWICTLDAIRALGEADLVKTIRIRNEPMPALDAINRQLTHYAYHVGQIVYLGKIVLDKGWLTLSIPKKKA